MIYILENTDKLDENFLSQSVQFLSLQRLKKIDDLKIMSDKINSASVYLLLRYAMKKEYGIDKPVEFTFGKHSKPYLAEYPELYFNFSHCRNSCACITSPKETAVDIADMRKISLRTASYFCSKEEFEYISRLEDPSPELIKLWSMKECYSKLDGSGLYLDFKEITGEKLSGINVIKRERYYCSYYGNNEDKAVILSPEILLQ